MPNETVLDAYVAELTCDDVSKCQAARRELVRMGTEAVPALIEALKHPRQWVRWEAAKALGMIGDPAATEALVKAMEHNPFDVRWVAAEALVSLGDEVVVPLLKALAANPQSVELRQGARHVLLDMDLGEHASLLEPVKAALSSPGADIEVPIAARKALSRLTAVKQGRR